MQPAGWPQHRPRRSGRPNPIPPKTLATLLCLRCPTKTQLAGSGVGLPPASVTMSAGPVVVSAQGLLLAPASLLLALQREALGMTPHPERSQTWPNSPPAPPNPTLQKPYPGLPMCSQRPSPSHGSVRCLCQHFPGTHGMGPSNHPREPHAHFTDQQTEVLAGGSTGPGRVSPHTHTRPSQDSKCQK